MADTPSLEVVLSGKLNQLQQDFNSAGDMADQTVDRIEQAFANANPSLNLSSFAAFGLSIGAATAGVLGLLAALAKVNSEVADIARAAQFLNTTTDNFQALRFAGTTTGISSEKSQQDLENVARLLNDAQRNENTLSKLLDANNLAYKDRNGQLISMNDLLGKGAGLIQNAASYADKVQIAKMLGLSPEWVSALEQGAAAFKDIADGAAAAGAIIDRETIAKAQLFDDAWKQSSSVLTAQFKAAIADIGGYFDDLLDRLNKWIEEHAPGKGGSGGGGSDKFDAVADALAIVGKQALGTAQDIDQVARALENARSKQFDREIVDQLQAILDKARETASAVNAVGRENYESAGSPLPRARPANAGIPTNPTKIPSRDDGSDKDAFDRSMDALQRQTALFDAQAETVGKDTAAKARDRAEQELTQALLRAGLEINDQYAAKIDKISEAYAKSALAAAEAKQKFEQQQELIQAGGNQMISIMDGVRKGTLTAQQAVRQLAEAFITAAEKALLLGQGPLAGLFGTAAAAGTGGTGGLLGGLFGGFRAGGGDVSSGVPYVVGERGPEIFVPRSGGQILPNGAAAAGSSGGGGATTINISIDATGADQASVTRLETGLSKLYRDLPQIVAGVGKTQQLRGGRP